MSTKNSTINVQIYFGINYSTFVEIVKINDKYIKYNKLKDDIELIKNWYLAINFNESHERTLNYGIIHNMESYKTFRNLLEFVRYITYDANTYDMYIIYHVNRNENKIKIYSSDKLQKCYKII